MSNATSEPRVARTRRRIASALLFGAPQLDELGVDGSRPFAGGDGDVPAIGDGDDIDGGESGRDRLDAGEQPLVVLGLLLSSIAICLSIRAQSGLTALMSRMVMAAQPARTRQMTTTIGARQLTTPLPPGPHPSRRAFGPPQGEELHLMLRSAQRARLEA